MSMKAVLTFFLFANLLTNGCTNTRNENSTINTTDKSSSIPPKMESSRDSRSQLMWAGTLQKAEMTNYQYGTHILKGFLLDGNPSTHGKESIYALKSSKVNLNKFLDKKVIIIGSKVEGYPIEGGPILIEVSQIEIDKIVKTQ